jgi:hypothetical protein
MTSCLGKLAHFAVNSVFRSGATADENGHYCFAVALRASIRSGE